MPERLKRIMLSALLLLLAGLCSCVGLRSEPWGEAPPRFDAERAQALLRKDWLGAPGLRGVAMLRLEGRLTFGSRKFQLTVLLRRDGDKRTARAVIMGDMGLTLCDMDVTPSGHITHSAVPDLEKAPGVQRHIARTLRRMLLLPLPAASEASRFARPGELMLEYKAPGVGQRLAMGVLRRVYSDAPTEGQGRLLRLEAPQADWELEFSDWQEAPPDGGRLLPRKLAYHDGSGGYRVEVLLVSYTPEVSEASIEENAQ